VDKTFYVLGDDEPVEGNSVVTSVFGEHTLSFWSVDKVGNVEEAQTVEFEVTDETAPVTTTDAVESYDSLATIGLTSTDAGSGVDKTYYVLDETDVVEGTSVGTSAFGEHTLSFWSVDKVGNTEATQTVEFEVTDETAPVTTSDAVELYESSAAISLTATDICTGVDKTYYRLDGGAKVASETVTTSAVGRHVLVFWSVDKQGNIEDAEMVTFMVAALDETAPVTTCDAVGSYVSSATIKLLASDDDSGVDKTFYQLDGADPVEGTTVTTSKIGSHTLVFWSEDAKGNAEAEQTVTFTVTAPVVPAPEDKAAPVTTSDAKPMYVSSAMIKLTATDAGKGVAATHFSLDGAMAVAGTSVTTSAFGSHTLVFWSVDKAGNTEAAKILTFTVAKPNASISAPKAAKTMKKGKSYTVTGTLGSGKVKGTKAVRIYKYRKVGGKWKSEGYVKASFKGSKGFTAKIKLAKKGEWKLRTYIPADGAHAATWSAKELKVKVK